ncbi:MAG: FxSxx-COOH system tetratricopeptide repeat protein [Polyangia bacterium]
MRTSVRILHLSDLHARGHRERDAWRRRRVLEDSFWQSLDEIQEDGELDLICFTGDLADWGQADEYEAAGTLLTDLLARLRLPKERLFLVPGNHDIARQVAKEEWLRARQELIRPEAQTPTSRWLAGGPAPHGFSDEVKDAILERQRAYRDFLSSFGLGAQQPADSPHGKIGYRITLRLPSRPFDVHIIGLDSAWLAGDDADSGKLLLTEDQVMRLCTNAQGAPLTGVRIALIHHPLTDLADGSHCRRLLATHTDLVLRGHLHSVEPELWADPDSRLLQLATGCLYEGHLGDTYPNACQTIDIHVGEQGKAARYDLRLRAFSPRGGHWHDDSSLYRAAKGGRLTLSADGRVLDRAEPAHFLVPLVENRYFTGRGKQLAALVSALNRQGRAAVTQPQALSGLGGVGKTQLALAYAFSERHRYQAVLWVQADSEDSVRSGFAELANQLHLPGASENQSLDDTVIQVRHWLEKTERTLLICDGADSPEILRRYLPRRGSGHVIITSRAHDFQALGIVQPVEIVELPLADAVEFLLTRTARAEAGAGERAAAEELAQELGCLPLALEQAAAYVVAKVVSLADYLISYRKHRLRLLNRSLPLMGDYPATVATTWHLNFEEVKRSSPAVALLRFASFLAPDAIPIELILEGAAQVDPKLARVAKQAKNDPVRIGELLEPLLRYSLVRRNRDEGTISIHRMVQEVVKDSLHADSRREYAWRVVQALSSAFPDPARAEEWSRCERILRHALVGTQLCDEHRIEGEVPAHLHNQVALYLDHRLQHREAERLFKRAIALRQKVEDSANPSLQNRVCLAVNLCNLASLLQDAGRFTEAEEQVARAIQLLEKTEGPDSPYLAFPLSAHANLLRHAGQILEQERVLQRAWKLAQANPETLLKCGGQIATALAVNALDQDQHDLAEQRFAIALTLCKQIHGPDSPQAAHVLVHQGRLKRDQGKYQDAESVNRQALAKTENVFGREHPRYAHAASSLARALIERGNYQESQGLLEEARLFWTALSDTHSELPTVLQDLATCHRHLAHYAEAAKLGEEALHLAGAQSGPDAPALWSYLNTLGLIYLDQERFGDADRAFRRAMDLVTRGSGDGSIPISTLHNNIALVHEAQGQFAEALKEYEKALEIERVRLGPQHPETCLTMHNIAQAYARIGRYSDAKPLFEGALAGWRQAYGNTHSKVAVCLYGLAFVNRLLGDVDSAERQLLESYTISKAVYAPDHPDLAQSLASLGEHYRSLGRHEDALPYYEQALTILHKKEPDSLVTAALEGSLGANLAALGRHAEAERILRECIRKEEAKLGANNPRLGTTLTELGICIASQNRLAEAEEYLLRALKLVEIMPDQGGPLQARALSNLAHLRTEQGRFEEAAQLEKRVAEIRERTYGAGHPDVALSYAVLSELAVLRGQPDEARQHLARGLRSDTKTSPRTAETLLASHVQMELGDLKDATATLKDALRAAEMEYGPSSMARLRALHDLAAAQTVHGDLNGVEQSLRTADELLARIPEVERSLHLSFVHTKAFLLRSQGKLREAQQLLEQTLRDDDDQSAGPEYLASQIQILNRLADVLEAQKAVSKAIPFYERAQQLLTRLPTGRQRDELDFLTLSNLANNLSYQGQNERADEFLERAVRLRDRLYGAGNARHIQSHMQEAGLALRRGDRARAKELLESALSAARDEWSTEHPHWSHLLRDLGRVCRELGDLAAAREHLQRALVHDERLFGLAAPELRRDLHALMELTVACKDAAQAVAYAQRATEISRARRAADPQTAFDDEGVLALRLRDAQDLAGALAATERAFEILREFPTAASTSRSAGVRILQGTLHRDQGNASKALTAFDSVVRLYDVNPPQTDHDRHQLASAQHARGDCFMRQGRLDEARVAYETSLRIRREAADGELGEEAITLTNLAQFRIVADDLEGADALLREAAELARRAGDTWALVGVGRSRATVLDRLDRKADARKVLEEIVPLAQEHFGEQSAEAEELSNQLAALTHTPADADVT